MSNHTNFIRRFVCWILPLLVVLLIALYLVLSTVVSTHAAAPTHHNAVAPHLTAPEVAPDAFWPFS
jgi:sorbitol-specific phosphotransferase system component IIC